MVALPLRMNTTTAATKPAAKTFCCMICKGTGLYRQFGHGRAWNARCPSCKGAKMVSAAKWLRSVHGAARPEMTREAAIATACMYLGLCADGTEDPTATGGWHPYDGLAGLLVDCEDRGWTDLAERTIARASKSYTKPAEWAASCRDAMAAIREARAAL